MWEQGTNQPNGYILMSNVSEENYRTADQANEMNIKVPNCRILHDLLLHRSPSVCCLCLNNITEESPMHLNDEICFESENNEDGILMAEMLCFLLDREEFISTTVCDICVTSSIQAYAFIQMCTNAAQRLNTIIDSITSCLEHQDKRQMNKSRPARRVFIATDMNSLQSNLYYDKRKDLPINKRHSSSYCALQRFKLLCDPDALPKFICDNCDLTFLTKFGIYKHIKKTCNGLLRNGKIECTVCGLLIDRRSAKRHENACFNRSNTEPTTIEKNVGPRIKTICYICGVSVKHIKRHLEIHSRKPKGQLETNDAKPTNDTKPPLKCEKCGKIFKGVIRYEKHIRNDICTHAKLANQGKIYKCNMCTSQYSCARTLKFHMKIHSNNKDDYYECRWCQKRFAFRVMLDQHIVTHTGEKKFECTICNGKFVTKASLTYHTRTHTGEKPIKCNLCEETFLNSSRRATHMRMKHLPPQLKCSYCESMFRTHQGKRKHQRRHLNPKSSLYIGKLGIKNDSQNLPKDRSRLMKVYAAKSKHKKKGQGQLYYSTSNSSDSEC